LPRSGAPRRVSDAQIEEVIRQTLEKTPPAATHWSTRAMAKLDSGGFAALHRRLMALKPPA
jgi:hypothetical protein